MASIREVLLILCYVILTTGIVLPVKSYPAGSPYAFVINGDLNPPLTMVVGSSLLFQGQEGCPLVICSNTSSPLDNLYPMKVGDAFYFPAAMANTTWYYWCIKGDYGSTITILPAPESCTGLPDGTPCNDANACTIESECFGGICVGLVPVNCTSDYDSCRQGICDPLSGSCSLENATDGIDCTYYNPENDESWEGTCQGGTCTAPVFDGTIGMINLYFISFFSVGGTVWVLFTAIKKQRWKACNVFIIFPTVSLVATICYIFLDINIRIFSPSLSATTVKRLMTAQYCFDSPSAICLLTIYWWRLRVALKAAKEVNAVPTAIRFCDVFLIVPISWPVLDTFGILCTWSDEWAAKANGQLMTYFASAWNIACATSIIVYHIGFVYIVLNMLGSADGRSKLKMRLVLVAFLLVLNPIYLLAGAIWTIWDPNAAVVMMYASWVNEVLVFFMLNRVITQGLKGLSGVKSSSSTRAPSNHSSAKSQTTPS